MTMKAYKGKFKKRDGSEREMIFAKIHDIVKVNSDFIAVKITGEGPSRNYKEGQELVWDIEADDFRIFNWEKASEIREIKISEDLFKGS